jgi:hypothetical protein
LPASVAFVESRAQRNFWSTAARDPASGAAASSAFQATLSAPKNSARRRLGRTQKKPMFKVSSMTLSIAAKTYQMRR